MTELVDLGRVVRELLPRAETGRPKKRSIVVRWHLRGLAAPGGRCVRLRMLRLGGRYFTHPRWLAEFFAALEGAEAAPDVPSPMVRERQIRAAEVELAEAGF